MRSSSASRPLGHQRVVTNIQASPERSGDCAGVPHSGRSHVQGQPPGAAVPLAFRYATGGCLKLRELPAVPGVSEYAACRERGWERQPRKGKRTERCRLRLLIPFSLGKFRVIPRAVTATDNAGRERRRNAVLHGGTAGSPEYRAAHGVPTICPAATPNGLWEGRLSPRRHEGREDSTTVGTGAE